MRTENLQLKSGSPTRLDSSSMQQDQVPATFSGLHTQAQRRNTVAGSQAAQPVLTVALLNEIFQSRENLDVFEMPGSQFGTDNGDEVLLASQEDSQEDLKAAVNQSHDLIIGAGGISPRGGRSLKRSVDLIETTDYVAKP